MSSEQSLEVEREIFMRSLAVVKPPKSVAREFARLVQDVTFAAGTRIYERGTTPQNIYFILRGTVELELPGARSRFFEGDGVFGVIDALLERPHSRSAIAQTALRVLIIQAGDYFDLLEDNFEFARAMFQQVFLATWELNLELGREAIWEPRSGLAQRGEPATDNVDNLIERIITLKNTRPFDKAPTQAVASLGSEATVRALEQGETFSTHAGASALYVVAQGEVEIVKPAIGARFGPCELVGGIGALAGVELEFRATESSTVLRVDREVLFDLMEEQFQLARICMQYNALSRELIDTRSKERATESLAS